MKRRIKDSEDYGWLFRSNYDLWVNVTETEGEANEMFDDWQSLDMFLDYCDDIAEKINGYYSFGRNQFGYGYDVIFVTLTPDNGVIYPEGDYTEGVQVGSLSFNICITPNNLDVVNDLQEYAEKRNSYYGGR